jgi:hypothetical protein
MATGACPESESLSPPQEPSKRKPPFVNLQKTTTVAKLNFMKFSETPHYKRNYYMA